MNPQLKVGLLLDGLQVPMWSRTVVQAIIGSRFARIALILLDGSAMSPSRSLPALLRACWRSESRSLYALLDRRLHPVEPDAFASTGLGELLDGVPFVRVIPAREGARSRFPEDAIAAVRENDLDVLIRFGFRGVDDNISAAARLGAWSWDHGDASHDAAGGFWEVAEQRPVTAINLVMTKGDIARVLSRSFSATDPASVRRNRNVTYWRLATLLPRKLEELWALGPEELARRASRESGAVTIYDRPPRPPPSAFDTAGLLLKTVGRGILDKARHRLWSEQWVLLYTLQRGDSLALWQFKEIVPPKDRGWADPHLLARDGKWYVFLEEVIRSPRKGHISVMTIDEDGRWSTPIKIIEEPYHLSYPGVFEYDGTLYMLPESAANRTVDLYRCERFPDRWVHAKRLMSDVQAVDPTLFCHGGRWWMFVNIAQGTGASTYDQLFLYHAPTPLSETWTPHPLNPIVSDARCARPAGPIFVKDGMIIRPAQDCSRRYGFGMRFMRIDRLDETGYSESEIARAGPHWNGRYTGTHTFDRAGWLTVVDGRRIRSRFE